MIKRKVKSQIGNLIPNHKSPYNRGQMIFDWGVQYIVGKIFLRAIKYYLCMFQIGFFDIDMNIHNSKTTKVPILGLPRKNTIWMWSPRRVIKYTIGRGVVPPPKDCRSCKACGSGCPYWVCWTTCFQLTLTAFFFWLCKLISSWTFACEFNLVPF
jgi:hypothetical protein